MMDDESLLPANVFGFANPPEPTSTGSPPSGATTSVRREPVFSRSTRAWCLTSGTRISLSGET